MSVVLDFGRKKGDPLKLCMCQGDGSVACLGNYPYGSVCKRLNEAHRASTGKPIVGERDVSDRVVRCDTLPR